MNSDVPFIVTVKASSIYDDNNRYNIINNIKNKELINCLREHIVFEVDKIIFKNVTNQEELDYMYELLMLKQK